MRRIPKYNSEHNLYEQVARYLQLQYPDVIYRFDIAADLKLTPVQAAKHKRLHQERGYPGLFIARHGDDLFLCLLQFFWLHPFSFIFAHIL